MRIIRLLHDYGGERTNERRIQPGDYDEHDERLFGLADYLIENGHAVEMGVRDVVASTTEAITESEADDGTAAPSDPVEPVEPEDEKPKRKR